MPGPLITLILERSRQRLNQLEWEKRKRSLRVPGVSWMPMHEKGEPYTFFQRAGKRIPFFGSDVGFGQDYVQYRSIPAPVQGKIIPGNRPIKQRRGSTANLTAARLQPKSEIQETRRARMSYAGTDQKVAKRGSTINWDGKVRAFQKKKSFESSRVKGETIRDRLTREMANEPYSFLS